MDRKSAFDSEGMGDPSSNIELSRRDALLVDAAGEAGHRSASSGRVFDPWRPQRLSHKAAVSFDPESLEPEKSGVDGTLKSPPSAKV